MCADDSIRLPPHPLKPLSDGELIALLVKEQEQCAARLKRHGEPDGSARLAARIIGRLVLELERYAALLKRHGDVEGSTRAQVVAACVRSVHPGMPRRGRPIGRRIGRPRP